MHRSPIRRSTNAARRWFGPLAVALAGFAEPAFAFNVYFVGGDSSCGYTTIQAAVDAAAAHPGADYVWIANNQSYTGQHVVITNQDVVVEGGFASCASVDVDSANTVVNGTSGHSVFEIEGSGNVELGYMDITGASMDSSHMGGGIYFGGRGSLNLIGVWVRGNQAGSGGGIAMNPSGPSTLLLQRSTVSVNTASVEGGGVWLGGPATLFSDGNTYITTNSTNGAGGGIKLAAPAVANVSSNVNSNNAETGGGIAAYASDAGDVTVNLYSTNASSHVTLYGNAATLTGGGIYLQSSRDGTVASLCAQDFAIDANTSPNGGAAINADADPDGGPGANVHLNAGSCVPAGAPWPALTCATGPLCNEIADNAGQAIVLIHGGSLLARRFHARRNRGLNGLGTNVVYEVSGSSDDNSAAPESIMQLHDCLIADNTAHTAVPILSSSWAGAGNGDELWIDNCTIANNDTGSGYDIESQAANTLITNSIVYDAGVSVIDFEGPAGGLTAQYDLVSNDDTLPGGIGITQGAPSFVDSSNGDYHLRPGSLGIDYAPAAGPTDTDLDGQPRTVDLPDLGNRYGPLDLGAYELQSDACSASDTIFCNGFDG